MITDETAFTAWYGRGKCKLSEAEARLAWLAGVNYERRACARLALSVYDAMAHAIGGLIRSRGRAADRRRYE